jgi:hypothetical protein
MLTVLALRYMCLAHLLRLVHCPSNARAVLAAGYFLGGMPALCHAAYAACRAALTLDSRVTLAGVPAPASAALLGAGSLRADAFELYAARLCASLDAHVVCALPAPLELVPHPLDIFPSMWFETFIMCLACAMTFTLVSGLHFSLQVRYNRMSDEK